MPEVCLVQMPYAPLEHPSIALGVLAASLQGIEARTLYPNLWFAEEVGLDVCYAITTTVSDSLVGEWTFSEAAFPDFKADDAGFFELNRQNLDFHLATVVLRRGHRDRGIAEVVREVRERVPAFLDQTAHAVLDLGPRIVGCTSTFQQHCPSLALLRRIRELAPDVVTVIGGANCEGPMGLATHRIAPWVDIVVSGEADLLFNDLCHKLLDRGRELSVDEVPPGVFTPAHRRAQPAIAAGNGHGPPVPRAVVFDMDQVATPDYDGYFETLEESEIDTYFTPGLLIETARGCWWGEKSHCTFCGLNGTGMTFRSKSPDRAVEEFAYLSRKYGVNHFEVVDNIIDMRYFRSVLPRLAEEGPYLTFYETKANLKRPQLELMAKAGVRWIQPGIESLHQGILDLIAKGCSPGMNVQLLKWCQDVGIRIQWLFLHGAPGEKDEWYAEMAEWLPLIVHLQAPASLSRIQYDRFSPYHERPEEYGIRMSPNRAYSYVYPVSPEEAEHLAYFFEDYVDTRRGRLDPERRPGFSAFDRRVAEWRKAWIRGEAQKGGELPVLNFREEGDAVYVTDSRPCAVEREITLTGLARSVFKACDRALKPDLLTGTLRKQSASDLDFDDLRPFVDKLRELKILLRVDGRYLSLAVRDDAPPLVTAFPGGTVDVMRYVHDKRLEAHARGLTSIGELPLALAPADDSGALAAQGGDVHG